MWRRASRTRTGRGYCYHMPGSSGKNSSLSARLYFASVYHDPRLISPAEVSPSRVDALLWRASFVYFEGFSPFAHEVRCRASFHDWRPAMGRGVALLHRQPNLIAPMAYFGFWRAARLRDVWRAEEGPPFAADHEWAEVLRIAPTWPGAHSNGEGGAFGCWFELSNGSGIAVNVGRSLRVHNRSELARVFGLNISDIFRTPVRGKFHLWEGYRQGIEAANAAGGANRSSSSGSSSGSGSGSGGSNGGSGGTSITQRDLSWPPPLYSGIDLYDETSLRQRYFDNAPWRLEANVDFCSHARRLGYESIQIMHELCSMERPLGRAACGVELISCHASCLALRNRGDKRVCVPDLPLRTGVDLSIPCHCNASGQPKELKLMLNCGGNRAGLQPAIQRALDASWRGVVPLAQRRSFRLVPGKLRPYMFWLPECPCDWCEGNRSHVDRMTQA